LYSEQILERPLELNPSRWLRWLGIHSSGSVPSKRCENCGGEMMVVDERVGHGPQAVVYSACEWSCGRCEHQAESVVLLTWPSDS
jgi:hypothetical protein